MKYLTLIVLLVCLHGCDDHDHPDQASASHRRLQAPEIELSGLPAGLTLLFGGLAVLMGRRK